MSLPTILNVDDDELGRVARTKFLTLAGFQVTEAATGQKALQIAFEKQLELIVLDVNLPDMSGVEVCRRLKSDPATAAIPILHLSATSIRPEQHAIGLESGADSYLIEPVDPMILVATIKALLRARKAEQGLQRSNEELRQFAYMVAHELNEPLRQVAINAQLLARGYQGKLDAEADEFISYTVAGVKRAQSFIEGMLNFSQATNPDVETGPASCDSAFITALFGLQKAVEETGAIVTSDPLPTVMGNELRLGTVFTNLIGNALKYRASEPPRIHISAVEQGDAWLFAVQDNGIGIDERYWETIFGMFKRLHGGGSPGSGVGLALCKKIIENHGGRIWVKSVPNQGSTFYFTLPMARVAAARTSQVTVNT
jgi:two-component system, sensor histidine kinase and response regulator